MPDDQTTAVETTDAAQSQTATVTVATAPVVEPDVELDRMDKVASYYGERPKAAAELGRRWGFVTPEQLDSKLNANAREQAIEVYEIPAEKQKFVVGSTPTEIRQSAKELAAMLKPADTTGDTATQSQTATGTSASNEPVVLTQHAVSKPEIKSVDDAVSAIAAMRDAR